MSDNFTHPLEDYRGTIDTHVGAAYPGTRAIFRGRDIHKEVVWDTTWLELLSEGVGKRLTPVQAEFLNLASVSTSYPDPRVWNNRVASLAGSTRSTSALALSAALAVSEATIFGRRNEYKAVKFLQKAAVALEEGQSLDEYIAHHQATQGNIPGYGRPLHNGDERIPVWMKKAKQLGIDNGKHVSIAFEIEKHLLASGKNLKMNAGALVAAFGADFGMSARQWTMLLYTIFLAGMTPCYLEALDKPEGAMFAARCDDVEYTGVQARKWPEH